MNIYKLLSTVVVSSFLWNTAIDVTAMIPDPRDEQIVALTKERDFYAAKADYLQKISIIQQMFRGISNALWVDPIYRSPSSIAWNLGNNTIDGDVWRKFLCTMRYFGGNSNTDIPNLVDDEGTPGSVVIQFMTHVSDPLDSVYTINATPAPIPNVNAVFASFIGAHTIDNIEAVAEGNLLYGFRSIRSFINDNFPNLTYMLGHIGENDFYSMNSVELLVDTSIVGNATAIRYDLGTSISEIFDVNRSFEIGSLSELGITDNVARQGAIKEEIEKIYNLDDTQL